MISIARTFGAPLTVPAGNVARSTSTALRPSASSPDDLAREVHDVRVALERHQLVDLLGPEPHDAPDVVAGEIDEHHVLGTLLRVLAELGRESAVVLLGPAAAARPGDRPDDHATVEHLHHRLGRRADERHLGVAHEVHVRRRVHLAQHAVHVERVERALEVEALREHDLEDVAGEDVLARDLDRVAVEVAAHRRPHARAARTSSSAGGGDGTYGSGRASSSTSSSSRATARSYAASTWLGVGAVGDEEDVLDQVEPLAVVVERGDVAGEREHGVGEPEIVGGARRAGARSRARRRSRGSRRRRRGTVAARGSSARGSRASSASRAASAPWSVGTPAGSTPSTSTVAPAHDERARRVAPEEREPAPPLRVLDRLEQEARAAVGVGTDELHERRDRRLEVGQDLAPHRDDRVVARERAELVARRPDRARSRRSPGPGFGAVAEGPEEAGALARVAGAAALLLDDEEQRVAVAVVVRRSRTHWRSPEVSPLRQSSWRLRLQKTVRPSSRVRRSASSFIQASISTARCRPPGRSRARGRRRSSATAAISLSVGAPADRRRRLMRSSRDRA